MGARQAGSRKPPPRRYLQTKSVRGEEHVAGGRRVFLAGLLLGAVPLVAVEAAPAEDLLVPAQ